MKIHRCVVQTKMSIMSLDGPAQIHEYKVKSTKSTPQSHILFLSWHLCISTNKNICTCIKTEKF